MEAVGDCSFDSDGSLGLSEWLQDEGVFRFQRSVEEGIIRVLRDSEETQFIQTIQMLAWIGCASNERASLQREIVALNDLSESAVVACGFGKNLWNATCKVGKFIAEHKKEILIGAAICATGAGIVAAAGYTCSVAVGGVVLAGAGSVFARDEPPKGYAPMKLPSFSKEERALMKQSLILALPPLELPSSNSEILVTAEGIWANGQFFSSQALMQNSLFAREWSLSEKSSSRELMDPLPSREEKRAVHGDYRANRIEEPQPSRSKTFVIEGRQHNRCYIGWINGINNTLKESKESACYIQTVSGGHAISGIYNCTHGFLVDILEAGFFNHQGYSPNTARLLQNEWRAFHEANQDRPNAKLVQVCHSQGAIDVKNALIASSPEVQNRVIVVAIAPAAVVPQRLCFQSYNYASEKDFIYKLEPDPVRPIISLTLDDVILPTFGDAIDDRGELILLTPHPEAEGIDHAVQSPTYHGVLKNHLEIYEQHKGEYLPKEKS